jgi:K+-transporting ATPase ATPase B chain
MDPVAQLRKQSLADRAILSRAILDSFRKLNPRTMVKNPVMFVVEVGAVLTTIQLAWNTRTVWGTSVLGYRLRFGCGSQFFLPISRRPWPKAEARRKPTPCVKHGRTPKRVACATTAA